ncbi:MAG: ester cyclase [Xanthomonadales bacterium]|jgi:predicted SnoaL-like aldol condensation-catalyzing enzyme|nr:ester cyclase [Xanthomonadales bacterium]
MKAVQLVVLFFVLGSVAIADDHGTLERNKQLAREFYEQLWFTGNTDRYVDYVADTYVVHDVGPYKGLTEPAVTQKEIADRFHSFGKLFGEIDYQIAEGDKVATRWFISLEPTEAAEAMGMTPVDRVAIINVFRFDDAGKIVEIWNHRHDVELPRPPEGARGIE